MGALRVEPAFAIHPCNEVLPIRTSVLADGGWCYLSPGQG